MKTINPSAETGDLLALWIKAKDAELAWQTHRRELEAAIIERNAAAFDALKVELEQDKVLSRKVQFGELVVTAGRDLDIDQVQAAILSSQYPQLVNVALKSEYKPVARHFLPLLAKPETEIGQRVAEMTTFKPTRLSFAKS